MNRIAPIALLAAVLLSLLYSMEFVMVHTRLSREAVRISGVLRAVQAENKTEANRYFGALGVKPRLPVTRWVVRGEKLWIETSNGRQAFATPVPAEFMASSNSRIFVTFGGRVRGPLGRSVMLPDADSSTPKVAVRYRISTGTHLFFVLITAILLMGILRTLRVRPPKSGDHQTELEEEIAYLSRTYQNLSKSLRMERQKVEAILNSAPDGIFTCSPDARVTFWNRAMEALTTIPNESAVGKEIRDLMNIFTGQGQLLAEPFSATFNTHETVSFMDCQIEALGTGANGANVIVPVALGAAPVRAEEGPVEEIVVTVKDIRAQKVAERLRKDMQAMITHDLRSPLSAMLGYAGLIQNAKICKNEEDALKYLENLVRAGKEMMMLISNLLGWSCAEEGKLSFQKESLHISPILKETAESFGVLAKPKNLSIVVGAPEDLWALTDGDKLKEILSNLIGNAIKFSRPGGTVHVSAQHAGSQVRISVSDEGMGMSSEELANLFKKFSDVRKPGSGTGLGLYIVKTLTEALDGAVEVESEPGRGTTLSILLPSLEKAPSGTEQLSLLSLVGK